MGLVPGLLTSGLVLLVFFAAILGLLASTDFSDVGAELGRSGILPTIRFTLWQAFLSTIISIALAIPLSRALCRRTRFLGRRLLLLISNISLVIPVMVAVIGIVAVHGYNGWINQLLALAGLKRIDYLYGLGGILIAHAFFNLPLITRILIGGLASIPQREWDLARMFGMRSRHLFQYVEWPMMRTLIPGAAGLVFLLCFTSFAIVLTLGGGPGTTTLEVAVYQAVRLDFDLPRAVVLSFIQIGICLVILMVLGGYRTVFPLRTSGVAASSRPDAGEAIPRIIDVLVIGFAVVFLVLPLAAVAVKAISGNGWQILGTPQLWNALLWSLVIALSAGLLSTLMAFLIASAIAASRVGSETLRIAGQLETVSVVTLLVPPITLGTGLFLFFRQFTDAISLGLPLVIMLNAILALAFAVRILVPPLQLQMRRFRQLERSLGIDGFDRFRLVTIPVNRQPIAYSLAISTTLSAGDMGVIALFGTENLSTLPLLMYRLIGSYRIEQAAVVAVVLCSLCLLLFWSLERLGAQKQATIAHGRGNGRA